MNYFIDIHCHLDLLPNTKEAIENAKKANVISLAQGVNPASNRKVLAISKEAKNVRAALGMYPIDALKLTDSEIEQELKFIRREKESIVAIGEVGLDFKEDTLEHNRQIEIFKRIILLSMELDKPIIIHSRKAEKEVIEILEELKTKKVIMHCFSGKFSLVKKIIENKWFLTIPTSVVNSEHFQKVAKECPINQLFAETDSPYLHPHKLWPNEPANVIESYKKIAQIKDLSINEVREKLFENYTFLF